MQAFSTVSLTAAPGQTASKSVSLVTNWPAWVTRYASTAKALGRSASICSPCQKQALAVSSRNGPKVHCEGDGMDPSSLTRQWDVYHNVTKKTPKCYDSVMTSSCCHRRLYAFQQRAPTSI